MSKLEQVKKIKRMYLDLIAENCKKSTQMLSKIMLDDHQNLEDKSRTVDQMNNLLDQAFEAIASMSTDDFVQALDFPPVLEELTSINGANREVICNMLTEMLDKDIDISPADGGYPTIFLMHYFGDVCQLHNFVETWLRSMVGNGNITKKEANNLIDQLDQKYFNDVGNVVPLLKKHVVNTTTKESIKKG